MNVLTLNSLGFDLEVVCIHIAKLSLAWRHEEVTSLNNENCT